MAEKAPGADWDAVVQISFQTSFVFSSTLPGNAANDAKVMGDVSLPMLSETRPVTAYAGDPWCGWGLNENVDGASFYIFGMAPSYNVVDGPCVGMTAGLNWNGEGNHGCNSAVIFVR